MTTRVLPVDEWHRLAGTEIDQAWSTLPESACVVVVEDEGRLVGCHVLMSVVHAECLWIHPDHRTKSSAARRLWSAVQKTLVEHFGATAFVTAAIDDRVRGLIAHVGGVQLPGEAYVVTLKERISCR